VRFDCTSLDPSTNRLYVAQMDAGQLLALDVRTRRVVETIPAPGVHGVLAVPSLGRVFVSDESGGVETVFDVRGHRVATIDLGGEAGNVQYDPGSGRVLVDVQTRNEVAIVDPRRNRIVRRVIGSASVGDSPDVLAFDSSSRRLYVAAESGVVAVFVEHGRSLTKLGQALLAPEAHTVAVDSRTHLVDFPLQSGSSGRPQL